ncbi:RNA polymerase sigma-70 factor, Bacteroides expansion family 1 [Dyadobacter sp. SG02]|uniref:RNA polymerase sigma-70 factor n=1 Tax=Dyadobacter sp. SG02 TaxID=1855291 RepID=UPI0008C93558|nr:RNA polymerase sigma-70 factor [Dyadobacter sp. SG02]SEJ57555.1 RNA polymerase sigma-70 factor, Bacteroides expansion family 1 [Dyadobacter sp. SG02]
MLSSPGSEYNEKGASWEIGREEPQQEHKEADRVAPDRVTPDRVHPDRVTPDRELFIRKTFEESPEEGCSLLFRLYYSSLCSYAVRFLYSKDAAADLVSEMFYAFWKNRSYESVKSSYRAYLFKSVQNRAYNYLASELKNTDSFEIMPHYDVASTEQPEALMYFEELASRIDHLVEQLPPQCQKVFMLNRFENKKIQEIATEMNLSSRTVEGHISKALSALRHGLKDHWSWLLALASVFS